MGSSWTPGWKAQRPTARNRTGHRVTARSHLTDVDTLSHVRYAPPPRFPPSVFALPLSLSLSGELVSISVLGWSRLWALSFLHLAGARASRKSTSQCLPGRRPPPPQKVANGGWRRRRRIDWCLPRFRTYCSHCLISSGEVCRRRRSKVGAAKAESHRNFWRALDCPRGFFFLQLQPLGFTSAAFWAVHSSFAYGELDMDSNTEWSLRCLYEFFFKSDFPLFQETKEATMSTPPSGSDSGPSTLTRRPSRSAAMMTAFSQEVFDNEVVPSSLGSITPILRVAAELDTERPRVAYLCECILIVSMAHFTRRLLPRWPLDILLLQSCKFYPQIWRQFFWFLLLDAKADFMHSRRLTD